MVHSDSQCAPFWRLAAAAKLALPGIAVLTKTKHSSYVSGTITEANLMQAYITSSVGKSLSPNGGSAKPGM